MIYDTFDLSLGPQEAGPKIVVARPIHTRSSHTKLFWISPNCLGGDSIMAGRTDIIQFLTHKQPQVPHLGHAPGDRTKIMFDVFISLICEILHI